MTQCVAETACRQWGARGSGNRLTVREMAARGAMAACFQVLRGGVFRHRWFVVAGSLVYLLE